MSMLPPKKKDWKKGSPQVGVFLRTSEGTIIEWVSDRASHDEQAFAVALVRGLHQMPERMVFAIRAEIAKAVKPPSAVSLPKQPEPPPARGSRTSASKKRK